jgi:hypothetical protein
MSDRVLLVLHQRAARLKARDLAIAEALSLFADGNAAVEVGGPLAERSGVAWVSIDADQVTKVESRVHSFGYIEAVDVVEVAAAREPGAVRWRKRWWRMRRVDADDSARLREQSPDRRAFVLQSNRGTRVVRGYRGSSKPLQRRGLPVVDARLLVNLATPGGRPCRLLDPFAGAGGILVAAQNAGHTTFSADIDSVVAPGLSVLTAGRHAVADTGVLPLRDGSLDAIATETPFEEIADHTIGAMLPELARVLRHSGRLSLMCVDRQAEVLRDPNPMLRPLVDHGVDRKGLDTRVLVWERR